MLGCDCAIAGAATAPAATPAAAFLRNDLRCMLPPPGWSKCEATNSRSIEPGAKRRYLDQPGAYFRDVRRVGLALDVAAQVLLRRPVALQALVDDATIAQLRGGVRRDDEHTVQDVEKLLRLVGLPVDGLQVAQHAREDLAMGCRLEEVL